MNYFKQKPLALVFVAAAVLLLGVGIYFFSKSGSEKNIKASAPKPALTVTTVLPGQASLPIKLAANGNITAWQEAIISSEANALRLTEVRANVGDRVRAGQVLAIFALESVQAEVAQSNAGLAEAEANALDAAGNAEKARTLQASGALSEQQINQYNTAEKTAKARLAAARALLTVQQVKLRQTRLLAPDDGVISARTATVGAVVGAGTELFRMIRGGRLEWRAEVSSSELGRVVVGTPATLIAANGVEVKGRVRMIAPTVDPQTRLALVYVDLPASSTIERVGLSAGPRRAKPVSAGAILRQAQDERNHGQGELNQAQNERNTASLRAPLKAGMFAKGEFDLGASSAMTVPQQTVVIRDGFSYVFVLGVDSHVRQVKIVPGRRIGERLEVLSGIKADAELVASGAGFLNDGDLVSKVTAK